MTRCAPAHAGAQPPFIDVSVRDVSGGVMAEAFPDTSDEEFESWLLLTAWRKLRKAEISGSVELFNHFTDVHVRPYYDTEATKLRTDPAGFFEAHIPERKYAEAVKILRAS